MHCSLVRLQAVWSRSSRHLHHALIPPSRIAGPPSPSPEDHMLPTVAYVPARAIRPALNRPVRRADCGHSNERFAAADGRKAASHALSAIQLKDQQSHVGRQAFGNDRALMELS
jgi:hypothetical protein